MFTQKKRILSLLFFILLLAVFIFPQELPKKITTFPFYLYKDKSENYYPAGLMGDYHALKFNENFTIEPAKGKSCIKIIYNTEVSRRSKNWAGIFWQNPAGNWGDQEGGVNLSNAKTLKFYAKGETGKEHVEFKIGGIVGENSYDTDSTSLGIIKLSKNWKEYTIDLDGMDLSSLVGGFALVIVTDYNKKKCIFYLDEIRYEGGKK